MILYIYIYVLNTVISWFFVCYINTFWCCLRSLRVLNSTVYQDTGQPSSDHGCCPDDSPCCWDPHTWTSRSVDEVRHPTWTPLPPKKNGAWIFNMAKTVYKTCFCSYFWGKKNKHKYKVEILKTKDTPTSNCWDPNNSKLGTQISSNKKLLPNIYSEFFSWVLDHRP